MPIGSAQDLSELIRVLSVQFSQEHEPEAAQLLHHVDASIDHVVAEGGPWISQEIHLLRDEWQQHRNALNDVGKWFAHHASLLAHMAQEPLHLAQESYASAAHAASPAGARLLRGLDLAATRVEPLATFLGGASLVAHDGLKMLASAGGAGAPQWATAVSGWARSAQDVEGKALGSGLSQLTEHGTPKAVSYFHSGAKVTDGANKAMAAVAIAEDSAKTGASLAEHHYFDAAVSASDAVSTGLKASPSPVTHLAGIAVAAVTMDADVARQIDWHANYMPPVSVDSMRTVYLPGAVDGLKKFPSELAHILF